jgi:short-chain fatty acids transporter
MIAQLGSVTARVFRRVCPDPFVIAIILTALTAVLALTFGRFHASPTPALLDAWRGDAGLWKFLAFSMQMCLILVTGHALAEARPVRRLMDALAVLPQTPAQAVALVGLAAAATGVINWGLGLIVGALLARDVGRGMHLKGVRVHYPLLAAAGYMALLVWHGGLSGSAPLTMTTAEGASKVLPPVFVERIGETGVPLSATIFSGLNVFVTGCLVVGIPLLLMALLPHREHEVQTIDTFGMTAPLPESQETPPVEPNDEIGAALPDRLDNSRIVVWLLAVPLVVAVLRTAWYRGSIATGGEELGGLFLILDGLQQVGLNEINAVMLALGLFFHGSIRSYLRAAEDAARGCAGIILQFPLYGGIMGMMVAAGLVERLAQAFARIGGETTIPLLSFCSAAIVNLFVPSGGGQWGIQGPVALQTAAEAGIGDVGKMIMSVAYGDQLTNMLQPFWALPLLAITGVRARDIVGYTAVVMLFAGVWMMLGLLLF